MSTKSSSLPKPMSFSCNPSGISAMGPQGGDDVRRGAAAGRPHPALWYGMMVALALVTACSAPPEPPACQPVGQPCGAAADCCDGLVCTAQTCQQASLELPDAGVDASADAAMSTGPTCGNNKCEAGESSDSCCADCGCRAGLLCTAGKCTPSCGDGICAPGESACCVDCGCPSGYACQANTCKKIQICGDGICDPGEDMNSCCEDCGCASGYTCKSHVCKVTGTSTLRWVVSDGCYNGEEIDYKFYDETRGWVWPSSTTHWLTTSGDTTTRALDCYTGDKICFGGRQDIHRLFWGVDIDNSKSCVGCCFTCADDTVTIGPLTCP